MKKPLIVRAEAEADLAEAYQWYEQRIRGLGPQFLLCVDAVMASIERNPQLFKNLPLPLFFKEGDESSL